MKHYSLNGKAVAELREQQGMTQDDLAQRASLSGSGYISLLETGAREPSGAVALKIAQALGVTFADITVTKDANPQPAEAAS